MAPSLDLIEEAMPSIQQNTSDLTMTPRDNPDEMTMLMSKVSALGLQLSQLQERYQRTQEGAAPSIETHSGSVSIPQLSPHPFAPTILGETNAPSVSISIPDVTDHIPKGAKSLPAFDDTTEDFQTWKLRLESIADIYKWTESQKRSVVMSSLRGEPAKFVFKALGPEVRNDYKALIDELTTRFTEFESQKVFRTKYRNLRQEPGQSEQELAAAIKMMYGRAFPGRDRRISQEDMVSKFLEALHDNAQRTALEYPTVPETLDAALRQAIHYREAVRRTNEVDEGFGRAYRVRETSAEEPTGELAYQYQEKVQAVGRSLIKAKTKAVTHMAPNPAMSQPQAREPTVMGNDEDGEPTFSLKQVQQLLGYARATGAEANWNESQGHGPAMLRPGDQRSAFNGKDVVRCDYCSKKRPQGTGVPD